MHKVGVYGSLRRGLYNHVLLHNEPEVGRIVNYLGTETLNVPYQMHSFHSFPALTPCEENNDIVFEIYEVNDEVLRSLDRLEGYNPEREENFYNRATIETSFGDALFYHMFQCDNPLVPSGDWYEFKLGKKSEEYEEAV